jgi:hypothetical protein
MPVITVIDSDRMVRVAIDLDVMARGSDMSMMKVSESQLECLDMAPTPRRQEVTPQVKPPRRRSSNLEGEQHRQREGLVSRIVALRDHAHALAINN